MRYTGPKNKISRREGIDLGSKTSGSKAHGSLLRRLNVLPGQHGTRKRRKKQSERGSQLREKQKLRHLFGLTESMLKKYFTKSMRIKGNTVQLLGQLLEKRLDNIVYRLGFTPTRASARQLVSHRHIKVNEKVINISSYQVKKGDKIKFAKDASSKIPYVESSLDNKNLILPEWLEIKNKTGVLKEIPTSEEIEKQVNMRSVIEYYSR